MHIHFSASDASQCSLDDNDAYRIDRSTMKATMKTTVWAD